MFLPCLCKVECCGGNVADCSPFPSFQTAVSSSSLQPLGIMSFTNRTDNLVAIEGAAPTPTYPSDPFKNEAADLIIRTSNNTDFRVFKSILSNASSLFETMFSLPQGQSTAAVEEKDPHVVSVTEDDKTIDTILRVCYPIPNPSFDPATADRVMEAGIKYDMAVVLEYIRTGIPDIAKTAPVKAFGIAYRAGLREEAKTAAKCSLHFSLQELLRLESDSFDTMCHPAAVRSLVAYHMQCRDAVHALLVNWDWIDDPSKTRFFLQTHNSGQCAMVGTARGIVHAWLYNYITPLSTSVLQNGKPLCSMGSIEPMWGAFLQHTTALCHICRSQAARGIPETFEMLRDAIHKATEISQVDLSHLP
ncbi:hypothetical protein BXZ70DRAFT_505519 [Cristinia sonorae]|uniref:BTB domain-containing protein n=1 Tax=Cristinia sonorae TaxID=1940300 RepID=A0A8K0XTQ3_9AGAR|nr:hypothetical protein BXZ70DRAFT_505519 [Cristinia sonorae]